MPATDRWSPEAAVRGAETRAHQRALAHRKEVVRALLLALAPEAEELSQDYTLMLRGARKAIDAEIDRMIREA